MESFVRSPEPLKDNNPKAWTIWKEEFLIFMKLLGYMERAQSFKANVFKNLIGTVGLEIINDLSFERSEDKENLDVLLKKLDHHYNPQESEVQKRYKFFNTSMKSNESIENYIQNLKEKAKNCNFGMMTDSLIRDVIILHTNDGILRQKYFQEENLNCNKIIAIYKNHLIQKHENKTRNCNVESKDSHEGNKNKRCWRCHTKHPIKKCPAWNYKCTKCNMLHHFEKCCKGREQNAGNSLSMNNLNIGNDKHVKENKMI